MVAQRQDTAESGWPDTARMDEAHRAPCLSSAAGLLESHCGSGAYVPCRAVCDAGRACCRRQSAGAKLGELSLARTPIGNKGATALAAVLAEMPTLRQLDLCECGIADAGAACMHAVLGACPRLEVLDMSWNLLGGAACAALVAVLPAAESLRTLRLGHAGISDTDGSLVCHALAHCPRWRTVDLSGALAVRSHMHSSRCARPHCMVHTQVDLDGQS